MGEVQGIKLQEPVRNWWTDLFAVPGACEQCSRTVLLTLIEFMCLMAVPTVVGALIVLFAAFAPAAADEAIALMEAKVGDCVFSISHVCILVWPCVRVLQPSCKLAYAQH